MRRTSSPSSSPTRARRSSSLRRRSRYAPSSQAGTASSERFATVVRTRLRRERFLPEWLTPPGHVGVAMTPPGHVGAAMAPPGHVGAAMAPPGHVGAGIALSVAWSAPAHVGVDIGWPRWSGRGWSAPGRVESRRGTVGHVSRSSCDSPSREPGSTRRRRCRAASLCASLRRAGSYSGDGRGERGRRVNAERSW